MTKDSALRMALEALESCGSGHISDGGNQWFDEKLVDKAYVAIGEALAQPEQRNASEHLEPVANYCKECLTYNGHHEGCSHYTTPPQQSAIARSSSATPLKPLSDEEIDAIYTGVRAVHHEIDSYVFARAIEAAHGIKE